MSTPTSSRPATEPDYGTGTSVERALWILEALVGSRDGGTVTDLAARLGINKGVVHRLLASLVALNYVHRDELTQRYHLTSKLLSLSVRHAQVTDVYELLLPILRRLATATGELAELNWEQDGRLVLVAKAESPRRVKVVDHLGEELVLHASAGGKAWLAGLPESDALRLLVQHGTPRITENTITDLAELAAELRRVRDQGYAINAQESDEDVVAVAAPVYGRIGEARVSGAVSVVAPAYRPIHRDERVIRLTREAAEEIRGIWPFVSPEQR